MSVYESIVRKQLKLKRSLFDKQIDLLGQKIRVLRIKGTEDIYQDIHNPEVVSKDFIEMIFRFPEEIPLSRYTNSQSEAEDTRVFFFDLLPIEVYTKISDRVETRDIIYFELEDEKNNTIPMLLQVTEVFGKIELGVVWKKLYAAPQHGALPSEVYEDLKLYYRDKEEIKPLIREKTTDDMTVSRESRIKELMR